MSFLKAAVALAGVAAVGYLGYKAAKKHPTATKAILAAMANSATRTETASKTIHIHERETVITADESRMEGAMGASARAKETPIKVRVNHTDSDRIDVTVDRPVLGMLDTIDYADAPHLFGDINGGSEPLLFRR